MSAITTHILDTSLGGPAQGVAVVLERLTDAGDWQLLGRGVTDADGRVRDLLPPHHRLLFGVHRLTFEIAAYFQAAQTAAFYPVVQIQFQVQDPTQHYHVPLLLSPYGYSTYRGS